MPCPLTRADRVVQLYPHNVHALPWASFHSGCTTSHKTGRAVQKSNDNHSYTDQSWTGLSHLVFELHFQSVPWTHAACRIKSRLWDFLYLVPESPSHISCHHISTSKLTARLNYGHVLSDPKSLCWHPFLLWSGHPSFFCPDNPSSSFLMTQANVTST